MRPLHEKGLYDQVCAVHDSTNPNDDTDLQVVGGADVVGDWPALRSDCRQKTYGVRKAVLALLLA